MAAKYVHFFISKRETCLFCWRNFSVWRCFHVLQTDRVCARPIRTCNWPISSVTVATSLCFLAMRLNCVLTLPHFVIHSWAE